MARIRCRRHAPLLCAAAARSRADQDATQSHHRGQHRLALLQRAETRAEGVTHEGERRGGMPIMQTRRRVLSTLALAAGAGLIGAPRVIAAEPKLETTSVRLGKSGSICIAPEYVAEELLRAEGFTEIQYSDVEHGQASAFRKVDFASFFASSAIISADGEAPFTVLSGLHAGCFELFGNDAIRSIADLKGKRVGVPAL